MRVIPLTTGPTDNSVMNTRTQTLLNARALLQAPMAGSQDSALALAVCGAGGIGALPAALLSPEALVQALTLLSFTPRPGWTGALCRPAQVACPSATRSPISWSPFARPS